METDYPPDDPLAGLTQEQLAELRASLRASEPWQRLMRRISEDEQREVEQLQQARTTARTTAFKHADAWRRLAIVLDELSSSSAAVQAAATAAGVSVPALEPTVWWPAGARSANEVAEIVDSAAQSILDADRGT